MHPRPAPIQHWYRAGLINALSPWSGGYGSSVRDGSFTVGPMVWATAHTTQFTAPGWRYMLQHNSTDSDGNGSGSGLLENGGSYVAIADYDAVGTLLNLTIVIEKMSYGHSFCVRPSAPAFNTAAETATFTLQGSFAAVKTLQVWRTHWSFAEDDPDGPTNLHAHNSDEW